MDKGMKRIAIKYLKIWRKNESQRKLNKKKTSESIEIVGIEPDII